MYLEILSFSIANSYMILINVFQIVSISLLKKSSVLSAYVFTTFASSLCSLSQTQLISKIFKKKTLLRRLWQLTWLICRVLWSSNMICFQSVFSRIQDSSISLIEDDNWIPSQEKKDRPTVVKWSSARTDNDRHCRGKYTYRDLFHRVWFRIYESQYYVLRETITYFLLS